MNKGAPWLIEGAWWCVMAMTAVSVKVWWDIMRREQEKENNVGKS